MAGEDVNSTQSLSDQQIDDEERSDADTALSHTQDQMLFNMYHSTIWCK
jgi:hypothetical protein